MSERNVRRLLLSPILRRKKRLGEDVYLKALDRLDERALGQQLLSQLRAVLKPRGAPKKSWKDASRTKELVDLAEALYSSGRISTTEYVFYAASPVEGVHEGRWLDGKYDDVLGPIQSALDALRSKYGLAPDEYWRRGEGPEDHIRLECDYEAILDKKFDSALEEFGLINLAKLRRKNAEEFERLRERGRRSVFHATEFSHALRDIVLRMTLMQSEPRTQMLIRPLSYL